MMETALRSWYENLPYHITLFWEGTYDNMISKTLAKGKQKEKITMII